MAADTKVVLENLVDGYLAEAKSIKGSLITVKTQAERNNILTVALVTGSICFVSDDDKFYKWNGSAWVDGIFTREEMITLLNAKQDNLTAGDNVTITNNVISATDTTYEAATQTAAGLMSATDKTKLDTYSAASATVGSANKGIYLNNGALTATTYAVNKEVPEDAKFTDTTYEVATTTADGLMSSTDKTKLDNYSEAGSTIGSASRGVYLNNGVITATSYDIVHEPATTTTDGLMSSTDKTKLDNYSEISATIGASNKGVYLNNGVITTTSHSVDKDVPSDAKFTDTTYEAATTSAAGLMSAADKTKLDSYSEASATIGSSTKGVYLDNGTLKTTTYAVNKEVPEDAKFTDTTYETATTTTNGLMSAADKTKLNGIAENASAVSVSATGTATDEISYITVNGTEKKIAGGGSSADTFIVNFTKKDGTWTADKTFTEISTAFTNGKNIIGKCTHSGTLCDYKCPILEPDSFIEFVCNFDSEEGIGNQNSFWYAADGTITLYTGGLQYLRDYGQSENDYWTSLTLGNSPDVSETHKISAVTGVNDGTNWTSLTVNGTTKAIPPKYTLPLGTALAGTPAGDSEGTQLEIRPEATPGYAIIGYKVEGDDDYIKTWDGSTFNKVQATPVNDYAKSLFYTKYDAEDDERTSDNLYKVAPHNPDDEAYFGPINALRMTCVNLQQNIIQKESGQVTGTINVPSNLPFYDALQGVTESQIRVGFTTWWRGKDETSAGVLTIVPSNETTSANDHATLTWFRHDAVDPLKYMGLAYICRVPEAGTYTFTTPEGEAYLYENRDIVLTFPESGFYFSKFSLIYNASDPNNCTTVEDYTAELRVHGITVTKPISNLIVEGLAQNAKAGDAMVFDGTSWAKQGGYGYLKLDAAAAKNYDTLNYSWDGKITSKVRATSVPEHLTSVPALEVWKVADYSSSYGASLSGHIINGLYCKVNATDNASLILKGRYIDLLGISAKQMCAGFDTFLHENTSKTTSYFDVSSLTPSERALNFFIVRNANDSITVTINTEEVTYTFPETGIYVFGDTYTGSTETPRRDPTVYMSVLHYDQPRIIQQIDAKYIPNCVPDLPADAATKTYQLKAVNGVMQWVL